MKALPYIAGIIIATTAAIFHMLDNPGFWLLLLEFGIIVAIVDIVENKNA